MWDWLLELMGDDGSSDFSPIEEMSPPSFDPYVAMDPSIIGAYGGDNPYVPYGEGGNADSPSGAQYDQPGSTGAQFDWAAYAKDPDGYLKKLGSLAGGAGGLATDALKYLTGGGKSSAGLMDILPYLAMLGSIGTGINTNNKTKDATKEIQAATERANQQAMDLIGGARSNFTPYIQAGQSAIPQLQAMVGQGLASKFSSPIAGLTAQPGMQKQAPSGISGAMTLAQLARRAR